MAKKFVLRAFRVDHQDKSETGISLAEALAYVAEYRHGERTQYADIADAKRSIEQSLVHASSALRFGTHADYRFAYVPEES